jgi:hypothetical protein
MLKYFGKLIGETIEAYVDDIVVKSKRPTSSWPTLKKPSRNSKRTASNSTPRSAFLGS